MKYIFTLTVLFLALLLPTKAAAQQEITHQKYIFCTISPSSNIFTRKMKVNIDTGQRNTHFMNSEKLRNPETGAELEFNSIVDALNYMSSQGWDFVQTFVEVSEGSSTTYWLLRKELNTSPD